MCEPSTNIDFKNWFSLKNDTCYKIKNKKVKYCRMYANVYVYAHTFSA